MRRISANTILLDPYPVYDTQKWFRLLFTTGVNKANACCLILQYITINQDYLFNQTPAGVVSLQTLIKKQYTAERSWQSLKVQCVEFSDI